MSLAKIESSLEYPPSIIDAISSVVKNTNIKPEEILEYLADIGLISKDNLRTILPMLSDCAENVGVLRVQELLNNKIIIKDQYIKTLCGLAKTKRDFKSEIDDQISLIANVTEREVNWERATEYVIRISRFSPVPFSIYLNRFQHLTYAKKADFYSLINTPSDSFSERKLWTIQKLSSLSFLSCHVTNAFGGGDALHENEERRKNPFKNIINTIENQGNNNFQLSFTIIHPSYDYEIAQTTDDLNKKEILHEEDIGGSIGVILDYGYIYEAYATDISSKTIGKKNNGVTYRTAHESKMFKMSINHVLDRGRQTGVPRFGAHNEMIARKWTVGAIFYVKGVKSKFIKKLKNLADKYSKRKYINPKWIYRENSKDVPKQITKIYPVYEIDKNKKTWKIVYLPK